MRVCVCVFCFYIFFSIDMFVDVCVFFVVFLVCLYARVLSISYTYMSLLLTTSRGGKREREKKTKREERKREEKSTRPKSRVCAVRNFL